MTNVSRARAYARVNLIGEHTDYNGGWVLPTALSLFTEVTIERHTDDHKVRLISSRDPKLGGKREFSYKLGEEIHTDTWVDYLQGATKFLNEILVDDQKHLSGFTAHIESSIPEGSGLSSSAALEMSFLKALKDMFKFNLNETELALLGQRIENEFVGARVGIMDQMATSLAQKHEALFLDTFNLSFERIHLPTNEMDLLVINSGISHRISTTDGGYNQRRAECEEACKILGVNSLRETTLKDLATKELPPILLKRVRHVVTENARVKEAVEALKHADMEKLGALFKESHLSMKNDYEITIPEIDTLVDLCNNHPDVFGARLTGGGFGGSIVALTKSGKKEKVAHDILPSYEKETGAKGTVLA
jgi:galactokinase